MCLQVFSCFRNGRHSYKVTGAKADEHPPLESYWKPPKNYCCCCRPTKIPERIPFPETVGRFRGTPETKPITDFSAAIVGNERGALLDVWCKGMQPKEQNMAIALIYMYFFFFLI